MTPFLKEMMVLSTVPGLLMLITGLLFKSKSNAFPNTGFGYKTSLTVHNSETWKEGNSYAGNILALLGIINVVAWPFVAYIFNDMPALASLSYLALVVVSGNVLFAITDGHLHKMFDRQGNRK